MSVFVRHYFLFVYNVLTIYCFSWTVLKQVKIALVIYTVPFTFCFIFIACTWRWLVFTFEASFDNLAEHTVSFYFQFLKLLSNGSQVAALYISLDRMNNVINQPLVFARILWSWRTLFIPWIYQWQRKLILNHSFKVHSW